MVKNPCTYNFASFFLTQDYIINIFKFSPVSQMSFLVDMSQFTMQFSSVGHLVSIYFPVIAEKVTNVFVAHSFLLLLNSFLRISFQE